MSDSVLPSMAHNKALPVPLSDTVEIGHRILWFDEIESSNDVALQTGIHGTVIVSECQTAGRGRLGRAWHSSKGRGLWFSIALDGHFEGLTFAAALAIRDSLRYEINLDIKWPNDLLYKGKKICGILVESRNGRSVLGVGLNVLHETKDFPPELRDIATSLKIETGQSLDRHDILHNILTHIDEKVNLLTGGGYESIRNEWSKACNIRGKRVSSGDIIGNVIDIDDKGALVLETTQGQKSLNSGEIVVL